MRRSTELEVRAGRLAWLEARTFPFTPRNLAMAFAMWLLVSISLPTTATALIGPYRVVAVVFDDKADLGSDR